MLRIFRALTLALLVLQIKSEIININVDRNIDLTSQLAKTSYKIIAEDTDGRSIKDYILLLPEENLAYIQIKNDAKEDIKYEEHRVAGQATQYRLTLPRATPKLQLHVRTVSTGNLIPHPAEIQQNDAHLVRYKGELLFSTPYKTKLQKTTVKLSSSKIQSNTQRKPFVLKSNILTYGPYEDVEPFTNEELFVHFESGAPFLTVSSLARSIEISHWGNIAVEEDIKIVHTGAKLKGSFSRYEYQSRSAHSAIKSYRTILPSSSSNIYYRDGIGNISTSHTQFLSDSVELELRPRFPLFGGWKTEYLLGYNVPSNEYLYNSGGKYALKMRVVDHIFNNMAVEDARANVVLPEGATNIRLRTPYPVDREADSLLFTYLDTVGRPVISFSKRNLVENHIADFVLEYEFSKILLLREPLLVSGFIFAFFIAIIAFLRMDFSLQPKSE